MELIDKSALVEKINTKLQDLIACKKDPFFIKHGVVLWDKIDMYKEILSFLDAIEVKEVDLEKEMDKFYGVHRDKQGITRDIKDGEVCFDWKDDQLSNHEMRIAKHFFELGLKTKGE
jgi:hypothetical protein